MQTPLGRPRQLANRPGAFDPRATTLSSPIPAVAKRWSGVSLWLAASVAASFTFAAEPAREQPKKADDRELAILRAMSSVQNAAEFAVNDPARPQFHFRPPANWNNDPNGPLFYQGYYHLFYQQNPYGDQWDQMHWGHARSKDLVYWEHLPIALWPSKALGEQHCFSGCAALDGQGRPLIFYTSIGHPEPHCWIALPEDEELIRWKKYEGNPVLTQSSPGIKYYDFRDPYVFRHEGHSYMVHGGNLNQAKGGQAVVSLYEAQSEALTQWKYRGLLFTHPDPKVVNIECPNFFKLGQRFVLINSPHRSCDYFVGTFDATAGKFTSEREGIVDHGNFYAPNTMLDGSGRTLMWGWVNGFKSGRHWNGCMTLPRVLALRDGRLTQEPAPELAKLRGRRYHADALQVSDRFALPEEAQGDLLEAALELSLGDATAAGIRLRCSADGKRSAAIKYDGTSLEVASTKIPLKLAEGITTLKLRLFLDRSLLEVYADGGSECVTRVLYFEESDRGVELFAQGGTAAIKSLEVWQMKPIW